MFNVLVALQIFHVAFLLLHDWVPLWRLNNIAAVRAENPGSKLLIATVVSTAPFAFGLYESLVYARSGHPHWIFVYLWISYGFLFWGELRAWWFPYFVSAKPETVVRYERMFGETYAFLPARNGIVPNALHVVLHAVTLLLLIVLAIVSVR